MRLHCEPWIGAVLGSDAMRDCSRVVNGLRFYVPDPLDGNALTAYERSERDESERDLSLVRHGPNGVYALTPSGEHELAGLDVSELTETEATLKRVRSGDCQRRHER
jgi:hypothetical protein